MKTRDKLIIIGFIFIILASTLPMFSTPSQAIPMSNTLKVTLFEWIKLKLMVALYL